VARLLVVVAAAAAAVVLFVVLRPDDDEADAVRPARTSTMPTDTSTRPTRTNAAPRTPPARPAEPAVVAITVNDGRPVGGIRRVSVQKGRRVRFVVRSTVRDHVHLHGYDIMRDVGPGRPAQIALRATIAGVFEIELEDAGIQLAELRVT